MNTKATFTPGPYRLGRAHTIVADVLPECPLGGSEDTTYYGGYLIAESVAECNRPLLAASPEMFAALEELASAVAGALATGAIKGGYHNVLAADHERAEAALAKARSVRG
jgi:hypothetical protein